jgi:hypothetical protein
VKYLEYYDGLNWKGLVYNHYWLIVIIEAAWYCESRNKECIRFNPLKVKCNQAIKRLTKDQISGLADGTFKSIIYSDRCKEFLRVEKVKNKNKTETWIYPNISRIQEEIRSRKIENLDNGDERLARIVNKYDTIHRRRPILDEPSVQVSDSLTRQASKTRALSDSVQVSDRLGMVVTRANPKKVSKRPKRVSSV